MLVKENIKLLLSEALKKIHSKSYTVDTSDSALEDEMYDAQGEMQQFLSGDESEELLFGDYKNPITMPMTAFVENGRVEGIKTIIAKQGAYGKRVMDSLKKAMGNNEPIPPVTVWKDGERYSLISGRHRLLAAIEMGYTHMPVLIMYWRDREASDTYPNALNEVLDDLDFSSFKVNDDLNRKIWADDRVIREDVLRALYKIAYDYWESLSLGFKFSDIRLTGSLANYNWSKYSDLDLHILFDINRFKGDKVLIKDLLDTKTRKWNSDHDITIKGFDVELYLQANNEPHHSAGVYSLTKDKWVKKPKKVKMGFDRPAIIKKYEKILSIVSDIEKDAKSDKKTESVLNRVTKLKAAIKKMRKAGLELGGEMSTENIVFKLLRRNDIMEKISNLETAAYDKSSSLTESDSRKSVSVSYLKSLAKNVNNRTALKILNQWIQKGGETVSLTQKQTELLKVIEKGGPSPSFYSSKN